MSYLALYRKYRPKSFDDLVGQSYVSKIIKREVLNNQLSHAYLFFGPRGTGKTSTAKIIARMINCLNLSVDGVPCGTCVNCLNINNNNDIVEIDAASNNGVDEIRELRDKVNLVPTTSKYKIYIIDEVHMLTTQAFNALLKTLEEPPSHIIFILATTEINKIPITVISRCQKFQFTKFNDSEIVDRLSNIVKLENMNISSDVLYEIARLSDGGMRDAINMLDQLSSYKSENITVLDVDKLNGVVSYNDIFSILMSIYNKNPSEIVSFIEDLDKNGNSIPRFLEDLMIFLKDVLAYNNGISLKNNILEKNERIISISNIYSNDKLYNLIFDINDLLNKIKSSSCPSILTISFFLHFSYSLNLDNISFNSNNTLKNLNNSDIVSSNGSINNNNGVDVESASDNSIPNISASDNSENKNINDGLINDFEIPDARKKMIINNAFATASKKLKDFVKKNWNMVENSLVDEKYGSIVGILNDTELEVVGDGYIIFSVKYDSLLKRLYGKVKIIEDLLFNSFKKKYLVVFLANDEWLYEKNKYIFNLKKGIKYNLIVDENDNMVYNKVDKKNDDISDIDKVVSIFGSDIIEYK